MATATSNDGPVEFAQPRVSDADNERAERDPLKTDPHAEDGQVVDGHAVDGHVADGHDVDTRTDDGMTGSIAQADPFMPDVDTLPDPAEGPATGPGSLEFAREMDYPEHERTYSLFLSVTKWGVLVTVALLISMAIGFFGGGGLLGGLFAMLVLLVAAAILF